MNTELLKNIYEERRRTYHMVNAISETSFTELNISTKLKQLIADTQKEVEELYLTILHEYHEYSNKEDYKNA